MVWDDGQAGPCIASVHGWCMGAWQPGGISRLTITVQKIFDIHQYSSRDLMTNFDT